MIQRSRRLIVTYLLYASLTAFVGFLPLLIAQREKWLSTVLLMGGFTLPLAALLYAGSFSLMYPFFGVIGFFMLALWGVCALVEHKLWPVPALGAFIWVGSFFFGSHMLNADRYANAIGAVQVKDWDAVSQPKHPEHINLTSRSSAMYRAKKSLSELGSVGSQFQLYERQMTLQLIKDHLYWVAPLDFVSCFTWMSTDMSPAYIMVDAEDPAQESKLVRFVSGQAMRFSPEACFDKDLERHLWTNGYARKGLTDYSFEVDDEGRPWWVVTVYHLALPWHMSTVDGVVIVDPASGASTFYELGSVPAWVDRVIPEAFVQDYLSWRGEYALGWLNSVVGTKDLTQPEDSLFVYGHDNQPYWVTGMTSKNDKDDALVALVYTHARTLASTMYQVKGGSTSRATVEAVNNNQDVSFRHLRGVDPQVYNLRGTMTAVVPIDNAVGIYQEVAVVDARNPQRSLVIAPTLAEALRKYELTLGNPGSRVVPEASAKREKIEGEIDRLSFIAEQGGTLAYFRIKNNPRIFVVPVAGYPEIALAHPGDRVTAQYVPSGEKTTPAEQIIVTVSGVSNAPAR